MVNLLAMINQESMSDKDHSEGEDRISELPEDILLTIVFQLDMKEAARTSILSKRWRYLWTNWTDLDFCTSKFIPECHKMDRFPTPAEATKFYNWVNQVIRMHSGQAINKFRIKFELFFEESTHILQNIDTWINFALSKRVKNLELCLPAYRTLTKYCTLDFDIVPPSLLIQSGASTSLTCLHLVEVNVSGEFLEFVLLECPLLEQLFVEQSLILVNLKVASSKLKQLTIHDCFRLEELEIDAVNLSYLSYIGGTIIEFKTTPSSLNEAAIGGFCCLTSVPICQQIECFAMQLSKLSLFLTYSDKHYTIIRNIPAKSLPCFSNLKFLELTYSLDSIVDLPSFARLLVACPLLCKFKTELYFCKSYLPCEALVLMGLDPLLLTNLEADGVYLHEHSAAEAKIEHKALQNLRVFEKDGFLGGDYDVNLVLMILNMAVQLDTFICHPLAYCPHEMVTKEMEHECRRRAKMFESFVAPKVKNYIIMSKNVYE